jgi:hypothetical protein
VEGTVMIKRVCGHSSPYTFKPNERYGKQRLESFLAKKCPACTQAAIAALEAEQKAASKRRKAEKKAAAKAARQAATELTTNPPG